MSLHIIALQSHSWSWAHFFLTEALSLRAGLVCFLLLILSWPDSVLPLLVQWLKKLSQCLHVMERHMHYSMITYDKNLIILKKIYDIISKVYNLNQVIISKIHGLIK